LIEVRDGWKENKGKKKELAGGRRVVYKKGVIPRCGGGGFGPGRPRIVYSLASGSPEMSGRRKRGKRKEPEEALSNFI